MSTYTDSRAVTAEPTSDSDATRVVLVDARPDRRGVMRQMFDHSDVAVSVVGEADSQADAALAVEQHNADLVLIDFQPPGQDVLEAVGALRARFPALAIVVCSFVSDAAIRESAVAGGADAYLVKPVSARGVMATVRGLPRMSALLSSATH